MCAEQKETQIQTQALLFAEKDFLSVGVRASVVLYCTAGVACSAPRGQCFAEFLQSFLGAGDTEQCVYLAKKLC